MKFIFVSYEEVLSIEKQLEPRFALARSISGTQKLHRFIPVNEYQLTIFDISNSELSKSVDVTDSNIVVEELAEEKQLEIFPGVTFVAYVYDNKWWIGIVKESRRTMITFS